MEDKSLELLTEEQRKLHEEFTQCQKWEDECGKTVIGACNCVCSYCGNK